VASSESSYAALPPNRTGSLPSSDPISNGSKSYVSADKTFCAYLAKDEDDIIKKHAEISGFPATKITEVRKTRPPSTLLKRADQSLAARPRST
jgi:hypothetical protein